MMTREEAIQILSTRDAHGVLCGYTSGVTKALDMAIDALSIESVPIEDVWQGVQPLKDKILELEEKLYLQNEKQKVPTIDWNDDQISKAEVLALINKAMYNTDNKDIQDYLFCGLRRDVHHLPTIEPSGNLVSRQDAIKVGNKIIEELSLSSIDWDDLKYWAKELFDALPSADRPKGEWIEYKNFNGELKTYECSNCKHPQGYKTPYCCECGADMRGDVM